MTELQEILNLPFKLSVHYYTVSIADEDKLCKNERDILQSFRAKMCYYTISINDEIDELLNLANTKFQFDDENYAIGSIENRSYQSYSYTDRLFREALNRTIILGNSTEHNGLSIGIINNQLIFECPICNPTPGVSNCYVLVGSYSYAQLYSKFSDYFKLSNINSIITADGFVIGYSAVHNYDKVQLKLTVYLNGYTHSVYREYNNYNCYDAIINDIEFIKSVIPGMSIFSYFSDGAKNIIKVAGAYHGSDEIRVIMGNCQAIINTKLFNTDDCSSLIQDRISNYLLGKDVSTLPYVSYISKNKSAK